MDRIDASELAARAGATSEDVERMERLGILSHDVGPGFGEPDIHRVRLCMACERAGIPLEHIGTAIAGGHLSLAFFDTGFMKWPAHGGTTFDEACAASGVSLEFLQTAYEALEFPRPEPTDRVREDDMVVIEVCVAGLAAGISNDVALRAFRAYGENLRRISEAIHALYHGSVELPLLAAGLSEPQMREIATAVSMTVVPITDRLVMSTYRRHIEKNIVADLVDHIETALEATGIHRRREANPPAICFLDLAGYTRLTEERGDRAAAQLAADLSFVVRGTAIHHVGRPIKWLGDGVMLYFPDPSEAVAACLEMVEALPEAGLPDGHVGISAGPVVQQDGDYYGRTVNLAARISTKAGAGEVLVNDDVVDAVSAGALAFHEVGPVELKGFAEPVRLHRAAWS